MAFKKTENFTGKNASKSIDETVDETVLNMDQNIDFSDPDDLKKLYTTNARYVSHSLTLSAQKVPGIDDLANLVNRVNRTHKAFSTFKKMEESYSYRFGVKTKDFVSKKLGKKVPNREIFSLFLDQQKNILEMNHALARMTYHYKNTLKEFSRQTDYRIEEHDSYVSTRLDCQSELPFLRKSYLDSAEKLDNMNQNENPTKYNEILREYRNARDNFLDSRALWERSSYHDRNLRNRVKRLTSREEVFRKQLQNTMMLSERVLNYQKELDDNVIHWIGSKDLAEGVSHIMRGVDVLDEYNKEMNSIFEQSVRGLVDAVRTQRFDDNLYDNDVVSRANEDLEALSEERAISYMKDYK